MNYSTKNKSISRILAMVLAVAMVLTSGAFSPVQVLAASNEVVSVVENDASDDVVVVDAEENNSGEEVENVSEDAEVEVVDNSADADTVNEPAEEPVEAVADDAETRKIDVYDFAATELDTTKYNNILTKDIINAWFPGVAAGSKSADLSTFETKDGDKTIIKFFSKKTNNRLRTTNTELTRYDEKSFEIKEGDYAGKYNGYLYDNGGDGTAYLAIPLEEGDKVTAIIYANNPGDKPTIYFMEDKDGADKTLVYPGAAPCVAKLYAPSTGMFRIGCSNMKFCVARIYIEHVNDVSVKLSLKEGSSNVSGKAYLTNTSNNKKYEVVLGESVTVKSGYDYKISLEDKTHAISEGSTLSIPNSASGAIDATIKTTAVAMSKVTGTITLSGDKDFETLFKDTELVYEKEDSKIYCPEIEIKSVSGNTAEYSVNYETGATYTLKLIDKYEGSVQKRVANDYYIETPAIPAYSVATDNVAINIKPVATQDVTIKAEDSNGQSIILGESDVITFTNVGSPDGKRGKAEDKGYAYKFKGNDSIKLRTGTYDVKISLASGMTQKLTTNLQVTDSAVEKTVVFVAGIVDHWNFADEDFKNGGYTNNATDYVYNQLKFKGGAVNKTYLLMNAGKISVPVAGPSKITVNSCYQYSFYFENESEDSVGKKTGSTSQIDSFSYDYKGTAGFVDITSLGTSFICEISVEQVYDYKEKVTVGKTGCDYTTVQDAIDAISKMDRGSENKRVVVEIAPGDYEEQLRINIPNITLKNASATPSIELTNKGVDIDPNAVRITWYYGTGYNYYSMTTAHRYNADVLRVNKENGYETFTNDGDGNKNNCYWDASTSIMESASGFEADGIIFENSFNQYQSKAAAEDVIVDNGKAKEGSKARSEMEAGDITVQQKEYVERAAALAVYNNVKNVYFNNCKFIGRQDVLYGGTSTTMALNKCDILGGTDYIFGAFTAIFNECNLKLNTDDTTSNGVKNDVAYITAPQQKSGRGYLFYNCHIMSAENGKENGATYSSKSGYLGRAWEPKTSEAVFVNTKIDEVNAIYATDDNKSLIDPRGWKGGLSESKYTSEYNTTDAQDNSALRTGDGCVCGGVLTISGNTLYNQDTDHVVTAEAFLGTWKPFGEDFTIDLTPKAEGRPAAPEVTPESTKADYPYEEAIQVTMNLSNETVSGNIVEGKKILYTLDGSDPTVYGVEYKEPITIDIPESGTKKTYISAVALAENGNYSDVVTRVYEMRKPEGTTIIYNLTASKIAIEADKQEVPAGSKLQDADDLVQSKYFKINSIGNFDGTKPGVTVLRGGATATKAFEISKWNSASVSFTVNGKADVTLHLASTGGSNWSLTALRKVGASEYIKPAGAVVNGSGNTPVINSDNTVYVYGNQTTGGIVTYKGLEKGEYEIVSPDDSGTNSRGKEANRNFWLVSAKVADVIPTVTNAFNLTASKITIEADKQEVPAGSKLQDADDLVQKKYFKINSIGNFDGTKPGVTVLRGGATATKAFEVSKWNSASVSFTVGGKADVTLHLASTGGSNWSLAALRKAGEEEYIAPAGATVNGSGKDPVINSDNTVYVYGNQTTGGIVTYKGLTAGEYEIVSPDDSSTNSRGKEANRNFWLVSAKVVDSYPDLPDEVRAEWKDVATPTISANKIVLNKDNTKVDVTVDDLYVGANGGDLFTLVMYNEKKKDVETQTFAIDCEGSHTFTFTPPSSGNYTFKGVLTREDEVDEKETAESAPFTFYLPMGQTTISAVTSKSTGEGKGVLEVTWSEVLEADAYDIIVSKNAKQENPDDGTFYKKVTVTVKALGAEGTVYNVTGLPTSKDSSDTYCVGVIAKNTANAAVADGAIVWYKNVEILTRSVPTWAYDTYGTSTKPANNDAKPTRNSNGDLTAVTVRSQSGSGKWVPKSTDGVSFYYTKTDINKNFILAADSHMDEWTYSNGQEGAGLMVTDRIAHYDAGDSAVWNNAYQLLVGYYDSYRWNTAANDGQGAFSDAATDFKFKMSLGVIYNAKEGTEQADLQKITKGDIAAPVNWTYYSGSLEHEVASDCAKALEADPAFQPEINTQQISIVGNHNGAGRSWANYYGTADYKRLYTDFRLELKRIANGYMLTYYDIETDDALVTDYVNKAIDTTVRTNLVNPKVMVNGEKVNKYSKDDAGNLVTKEGELVVKKDEAGNPVIVGQKFIKDAYRKKLNKLKPGYVYVGFAAARNAKMTFTNIDFRTTDSSEGEFAAYEEPATKIIPSYAITTDTAQYANDTKTEIGFASNADGKLTIVNSKGRILANGASVTHGVTARLNVEVEPGENVLTWSFTPNKDFKPSEENSVLANFDTVTKNFTVYRGSLKGDSDGKIYVAPSAGKESYANTTNKILASVSANKAGVIEGAKSNPTDIVTAVALAKAGDTVIVKGGKYDMGCTITLPGSHEGTASNMINIFGDETDAKRPVLDFASSTDTTQAITAAGKFWHVKGLNVTNSINSKDGIVLAGSNNIFEDMYLYRNGNTGLQISKAYSHQTKAEWPTNNTVINCTSFSNADSGDEDADGFAAKLTCGNGNKFIGCIAAFNADDGWDLYAKSETGNIGTVTIQNCIAMYNGFKFEDTDKTVNGFKGDLDEKGKKKKTSFEVKKGELYEGMGNGNGFKLGGESLTGYHVLKNSIAFGNAANGITTNSCPDIQVSSCTSFNNEDANVTLYTSKTGLNTDYLCQAVMSYRNKTDKNAIGRKYSSSEISSQSFEDSIAIQNSQLLNYSKVSGETTFYYKEKKGLIDPGYRGAKGTVNSKGVLVGDNWFESVAMQDFAQNFANATLEHIEENECAKSAETKAALFRSVTGNNVDTGDFMKLTTAKAKNDDEKAAIQAAIDAKVGGRSTEDTSTYDPSVEKNVPVEVTIYADSYTTLGQIDIPAELGDGYEWLYPNTAIANFAGSTVEVLAAPKGYDEAALNASNVKLRSVLLNCVTVTGVKLDGYDIYGDAVEIDGKDAELTFTAMPETLPANADLTKALGTATINIGVPVYPSNVVAVTATPANDKSGKVAVSVKAGAQAGAAKFNVVLEYVSGKTKKKASQAVSVVARPAAKTAAYTDVKIGSESAPVVNGAYVVKPNETLTFEGLNANYKAKVVDTAIVKQQAGTNNFVAGTVGTTTISFTNSADKTDVQNVLVQVRGAEFKTSVKDVIVDQNKEVAATISLVSIYGDTFDDDSVKIKDVVYGKTPVEKERFTLTKSGVDGIFYLAVNNDEGKKSVATGSYTVSFEVYDKTLGKTVSGTEYIDPLNVQVTSTMPKATVKVKNPVNLFYDDATEYGAGLLEAKCALTDLTVEQVSTANDAFEYDKTTGNILLVNRKSFLSGAKAADLKLNIHYNGYKSGLDLPLTVSVRAVSKAPKIVAEYGAKRIYPSLNPEYTTTVKFYDATHGAYINPSVIKNDEVVTDKLTNKVILPQNLVCNNVFEVETAGDNTFSIKVIDKKGGKFALYVRNDDWYEGTGIVTTSSIVVAKEGQNPVMKLADIMMSSDKAVIGSEVGTSYMTVDGLPNYDYAFDKPVLDDGNNETAKAVKECIDVVTEKDSDTGRYNLKLSVTDAEKLATLVGGQKNVVVKYNVTLSMNGQTLKQVPLRVCFRKTMISVTRKGNLIDINRKSSVMTITPKLENLNGKVTGISLTANKPVVNGKETGCSDAGKLFDVTWDSDKGCAYLTLQENTEYLAKTKYRVMPTFTVELATGVVYLTPAKALEFSVYNKAVKTNKITNQDQAMQLRLSAPDVTTSQELKVTKPANVVINDVVQLNYKNNFEVSYDEGSSQVTVALKSGVGLKNGVYIIKLGLDIEGQCKNVKMSQTSVKVYVNK